MESHLFINGRESSAVVFLLFLGNTEPVGVINSRFALCFTLDISSVVLAASKKIKLDRFLIDKTNRMKFGFIFQYLLENILINSSNFLLFK